MIKTILSHTHWAQRKNIGRLARRTADLEFEERAGKFLDKLGTTLPIIGLIIDAAGAVISSYNRHRHPDITGTTRNFAALLYGMFHAEVEGAFAFRASASFQAAFPEIPFAAAAIGISSVT